MGGGRGRRARGAYAHHCILCVYMYVYIYVCIYDKYTDKLVRIHVHFISGNTAVTCISWYVFVYAPFCECALSFD
jgi:hypothetical protein